MSKDPYRYFRIEARELIDEMNGAVLQLDQPQGAGEVSRVLRLAHTLKGAARVVKQVGIADHAHAIEDVLAPWRDGGSGALPGETLDALFGHLDEMGVLLKALGAGEAAAPTLPSSALAADKPIAPAPDRHTADEGWRAVRADAHELHAVLGGIAESHVQVAAMHRHIDTVAHARELAEMLLSQLTQRQGRKGAPEALPHARPLATQPCAGTMDSLQDMVQDLCATLDKARTALTRTTDQLDRELRDTRDTAEQLRLVPVRQVFNALARTVRDVARTLGIQARFEGTGGEVRLDAEVLGVLQPALVQMVRNAVAHGIEAPAQRLVGSKPAEGLVRVTVARQGRHAVFCCTDDGRGIDARAVAAADAAAQGRAAGTETLLDDQARLMQRLLEGGVSTAAQVTAVSGRGIGLNIVGDALRRLGGQARLDTRIGQGTTWRMTVPLKLAAIEVLGVEAAGQLISIPLEAVRGTQRVAAADIVTDEAGQALIQDGRAIPFMPLSGILQLNERDSTARVMWTAVTVQSDDGDVALGVDRLMGTSQVVMHPLPELTPASELIAGASLDVEGHPRLVLAPPELMRAHIPLAFKAEQARAPALPVLIVDDSLTTRMLEQGILASAGYEAHVAVSAEQGLEMAASQRYALFLVDVDMPGMDGFGFVKAIRADPALRHTPAILVTSRDAPEDRQRGEQAGANHYIVKAEFSQGSFLSTIRQLIEAGAAHHI